MIAALSKLIKRMHYPLGVMLACVRWYVAYPLSLRHLEEMMAERGVSLDHATVHRWAIKMVPVLSAVFRHRKRAVGRSWRMDETYIKVHDQWRYLYRVVDREGETIGEPDNGKFNHEYDVKKAAILGIHFKRFAAWHRDEKVPIDRSGMSLPQALSIDPQYVLACLALARHGDEDRWHARCTPYVAPVRSER